MALPNVTELRPQERERLAGLIKGQGDILDWPDLSSWNSAPCSRHSVLTPGCFQCGIRLRRHQRLGAAWLFSVGKGFLADTVGSGKTAQIAAVFAMCRENGELSPDNRAVVVCKAAAVGQWVRELRRMLPDISVLQAAGTPNERLAGYMARWEVAVVSDRTFAPAGKLRSEHRRDGDVAILKELPIGILVYDDLDAMRNHTTKTCWAINHLAEDCGRVYGLHGTPLQKRLTELHTFLGPVGGRSRLGSLTRVRQRYVTQTRRWISVADPRDPTGRKKIRRAIVEDNGINDERIAEFRDLIAPLILRRTAADLDDVELPAVQVNPVTIDLNPAQRRRYDELRTGVLRRLKNGTEEISYADAAAAFIRGWQICSGLAALDGPDGDDSAKFDWALDRLTGDIEEKAVAFVYFRDNVRAFSSRLTEAGIGHVLMWSEDTDQRVRDARLAQFREDPDCKVLVGTTTIEQSLNLQVAPHLIAVDTILNPARMEQLVGRVRRQNSAYATVFFHHLLARDTQEDGYLPLLNREQAVADAVWDERSEIFQALGPRAVMNLVGYGNALAA